MIHLMAMQDFENVKNFDSLIIEGTAKIGKMTFLAYLITSLYKTKTILFTPQESYLFQRRLKLINKQFPELENFLTPYYLKEDWHHLKQKYGFKFLLIELERLITASDVQVIVLHRIGDFFEFQDRYEIDNFYKSLVKLAVAHEKIIVFIANSNNDNFEFINNIADDFTDVVISIALNEKSERLLTINSLLHNKQYPPMNFKIHENNFILEYFNTSSESQANKIKNVLIAELEFADTNTKMICEYLFHQPKYFNVKTANSLQTMLQEIFISPEIVIVFMKRTQENFETLRTIKKQLPNSTIITIIDQPFIRAEDKREAYSYGSDELFANDLVLDTFILSLEKASRDNFYTKRLEKLPKMQNVIEDLSDLRNFAEACLENSVYFTLFIFEAKDTIVQVASSGRKLDYICQQEDLLYYLAINTTPIHAKNIIESYQRQNLDFTLNSSFESIKPTALRESLL